MMADIYQPMTDRERAFFTYGRVRAETERLEAEVKKLREALAPFATEAVTWADSVADDYRPKCCEPGKSYAFPGSEAEFTVGDVRRAAAVLAETERGKA